MAAKFNTQFVIALVKRDLWKYFTNPSGYVFITLFIFLSAAAAFWQDRFFLNNLANLDLLNGLFPFLLLFFIPALSMSVWSEERKQGTDELLFTLPASSLEVVLGKYLAAVGVYTASLLLSLSHVFVLFWLGSPDLGLILSNYVGYWLIGVAMIAVGMLASLLTANATIAFILGAAFCSFFVFIDSVSVFSESLGRFVAPLGVAGHFGDFSKGVISFSGVLYFLSVAGVMLLLNVLLVEKRHWPRQLEGRPMWVHQSVRIASIVIAVISLNAILGRASLRLDATAEGLHSLSSDTKALLSELDEERPVFIQAFVSPEVPEQYVQVRANVLSVLNEIDSIGGSGVQVLIQDTEPFTDAARNAREQFGITPHQIPNLANARAGFADVFLGLAFTCGPEEEVIPFLDRGLSAEYEITRSIRVVARTERRKIGVVTTGAKLFGGFDFQSMQSNPGWPVVGELQKQYEVVQINPAVPITEEVDGLLVALPSTLSQEEMNNLVGFIEAGNSALLLVDPLPVIDIGLSPSEQAGSNQNPFMRNQGPPPKEKGNIQQLMSRLGVSWDATSVVWDTYNPHPDLAHLPPEVVFTGKGNDNPEAFNRDHPVSSRLQELVFLYPGQIEAAADTDSEFTPLLKTGVSSGRFSYFQMVQRGFFGPQLNRNLPRRPDGRAYTIAAHIREGSGSQEEDEASEGEANPSNESAGVELIVVTDLDFISQQFFQIRERGPENLIFDNVTFFLNCMDTIVGEESFISLRSKRVHHRTLERVEEQTQNFIKERVEKEEEAEADAEKALADAQKRLEERVNEVSQRPDLDSQTKQIMARNLEEVENRRFEVLKANIEAEKEAKVSSSKENMETQIRRIQSSIKTLAVLIPPIPVFVLGVLIFVRRQRRENEGAAAARRLRG